jgi:hypothetical protein
LTPPSVQRVFIVISGALFQLGEADEPHPRS